MPTIIEITAVGFDGDSDATDDRILWVYVPSEKHLQEVLHDVPHESAVELPNDFKVSLQDIDYVLPEDDHLLREKLRAFATPT